MRNDQAVSVIHNCIYYCWCAVHTVAIDAFSGCSFAKFMVHLLLAVWLLLVLLVLLMFTRCNAIPIGSKPTKHRIYNNIIVCSLWAVCCICVYVYVDPFLGIC